MDKVKIYVRRSLDDPQAGVVVELAVRLGKRRRTHVFLLADLSVSRQSAIRWLGKCGVVSSPKVRKALDQALENRPKSTPGFLATSPGWYGENFVLGTEVLGPDHERVANAIMLPGRDIWKATGTVKAWKKWSRSVCSLGPVPAFTFALAFAGPLLRFTGETSLVVMLTGDTSLGKTSLQRMDGTVWGVAPKGFLESFDKSTQAFEPAAMRHRDAFMVIDESSLLAQDARQRGAEFGKLLFRLASDITRESVGRDRVAADLRGAFLLSSNDSAAELIAKGGSEFTGQMAVRILDIPVDADFPVFIFDVEDTRLRADRVNRLLVESGSAHGVAARSFLDQLTRRLAQDRSAVEARITRYIGDALDLLALPASASATDVRQARSVAIIHAAGRLAIRYNVFPATRQQLDEAVCAVWQRIHHQAVMAVGRDPVGEFMQGLLRLEPEMLDLTTALPECTVDIAKAASGFVKHDASGEETYFLTEKSLKQLTGSPEIVLKGLEEQGLLGRESAHQGRVGKRQKKVTVGRSPDGQKIRLRLYVISGNRTALLALAGLQDDVS